MVQEVVRSNGVRLEIDGAIATIVLDRPEARNALTDAMRDQFLDFLDQIASPEVRAVVVTGEGTAFCAGGDISGMRERLEAPPGSVAVAGWRRHRKIEQFITTIYNLDKVTIAAVNGPAMGLGFDLALCCDFIVASDKAIFSMAYVHRGLITDGGGFYFLPRRVGLARAKELIYSGRQLSGEEAVLLGVSDRMVAADDLIREAKSWAGEFTKASPTAIALSKSILNRTFELGIEGAFALGNEAQAICYTSDEHRAAVEEFLNRQKKSG